MSLIARLKSEGPKRILALDGGGIRGALTLGYLEKIEQILRERHNNPDLKLCDYFDLIGGTSTGSIIAAGLAIGMSASEVKQMYLDLGGEVFSKNSFLRRYIKSSFDAERLRAELKKFFGEITLGSDRIKTGLCIVAKRVDTDSTWYLLNHPEGIYYKHNEGMLLRHAIRASTAAPTYFDPEEIDVGFGEKGAFVDGGVSMANNPALSLFLIATLKGYNFNWATGEENLLLVSIGTGVWNDRDGVDAITGYNKLDWASRVPSMIMNDANWQNQMLLQAISKTQTPWQIDSEVGDLSGDLLTAAPLLTYMRYNAWLDTNGLQKLGLSDLVEKIDSLREMSNGENRFDLAKIGQAAAKNEVQDSHFPIAFNTKAK
jgi:patatin-like phospholipase/acyl hydrolase